MSCALMMPSSGKRTFFKFKSSIFRFPTWVTCEVREGIRMAAYDAAEITQAPASTNRLSISHPLRHRIQRFGTNLGILPPRARADMKRVICIGKQLERGAGAQLAA